MPSLFLISLTPMSGVWRCFVNVNGFSNSVDVSCNWGSEFDCWFGVGGRYSNFCPFLLGSKWCSRACSWTRSMLFVPRLNLMPDVKYGTMCPFDWAPGVIALPIVLIKAFLCVGLVLYFFVFVFCFLIVCCLLSDVVYTSLWLGYTGQPDPKHWHYY